MFVNLSDSNLPKCLLRLKKCWKNKMNDLIYERLFGEYSWITVLGNCLRKPKIRGWFSYHEGVTLKYGYRGVVSVGSVGSEEPTDF